MIQTAFQVIVTFKGNLPAARAEYQRRMWLRQLEKLPQMEETDARERDEGERQRPMQSALSLTVCLWRLWLASGLVGDCG